MYIIIGLVIGIVFFILLQPNPKDIQALKHVELLNATRLYKAKYENSGFSIGKSGMRSYYRRKNRYVGTDLKFRVTYNTGRVATVTAREGTERCQTLLNFMENQDKPVIAPPVYKPAAPLPTVNNTQAPAPAVKPAAAPTPPPAEKKQLVSTLTAIAEQQSSQGLSTSETMTAPPKAKPQAPQDVYAAGEYKVGVTIPAGEYALHTTKKSGSYYEVKSKNRILFNGHAKGVQLLELCDGEYFEFSDATVQPMANIDLMGMNFPSCSLKVGVHIPPGEYLLTALNSKSNPISIYSSCRLTDKNLLTFEYVKGSKFLTLKKGNVITYENCKIELVESNYSKPENAEQITTDIEAKQDDDFYAQLKEEDLECHVAQTESFFNGYYTVGEDLPTGEYVIVSECGKEADIKVTPHRHKKERVALSFSGSCIITLCQGDSFEIRNGNATSLEKVNIISRETKVYMLKVGLHIPSGNYLLKQAVTSHFAVYYIMGDSMMVFNDALDSDAVFGEVKLSLEEGQYIYLENATLEPVPNE